MVGAEPLERAVQRLRHVLAMIPACIGIASPLVEGQFWWPPRIDRAGRWINSPTYFSLVPTV